MSQEVADRVHGGGYGLVVAVSDTFRLAPWADALAAQDAAWWRKHPDAFQFAGRKFSANRIAGVEQLPQVNTNRSSGVLALEAAVLMGATDIDLFGFDMHGSHYFGPHPEGLNNTTEARFEVFQNQFAIWRDSNENIRVVNCTPNSKLRAFPHEDECADRWTERA